MEKTVQSKTIFIQKRKEKKVSKVVQNFKVKGEGGIKIWLLKY